MKDDSLETDRIWKGGMGLTLLLLFFFFITASARPSWILSAAVIYGLLNLFLNAVLYRLIGRRVDAVLGKLSFLIEELTAGRKETVFAITQDTLLSKLQVQLLRLYEIMHSYEEREQKLRRQISANIGDLVHQINTPITNIEMYAGFLEAEDITAGERAGFVKRIREQAKKLVWLGEGFSRASRLETGLIQLKPERQKLFPILLQAVNQVMPKAEAGGMDLAISGEKESYARVDSKWTVEAIYNVLDNAVKYAEADSLIEIEITDMTSFVRMAVKNKGLPIKEEELNLIFTRFYRGKSAHSQEGVGIGLYLTREILTGQKGYIRAGQERGGRTVFELYFYKGNG